MKNKYFLLFILAMIQFAHIIDFMIIMPLGAQFMEIFDITPQQFSFIVSSYALAAFVAGLFSAMFIDQLDRKVALLILFIGFTIGTFACAMADSYHYFLLARGFTGAFGGVLSGLILAIIGDAFPFEIRGRAMGILMTAFSVASVVGVPAGVYLAATYNWRMPFIVVGGFSVLLTFMIFFFVPSLRKHIEEGKNRPHPLKVFSDILIDPNQVKALLFSIILMLGHFTIIPFIAPYMQLNIGFSDYQVTYIYLIGGGLTAVLLPLFGALSDRFGHMTIFTIASGVALLSIAALTNLETDSIAIALMVTSSYFVVASGRSVPATTLVTSVVKPENRGSFMSVRSSANELALFLSSFIAGAIVIKNADGSLGNYHYVGFIAIFMSVIAILLGRQLKTIS